MQKLPASSLAFLLASTLVSPLTYALGVGSAEIESVLGEPLRLRIPIFGAAGLRSEDVLISLNAAWDEQSATEMGGVDLSGISVESEIGPQGYGMIWLRGQSNASEPYVNFKLRLRWPSGSVSREYTLLLDLPPMPAVAAVINPRAMPASTPTPSNLATAAAVPSSNSQNVGRLSADYGLSAQSEHYQTRRGDSLWSIASRLRKVKGGSLQGWMEQLYQNNPHAFVRAKPSRLKAGVRLSLVKADDRGPLPAEERVLPQESIAKGNALKQQGSQAVRKEEEVIADKEAGTTVATGSIQDELSALRGELSELTTSIASMSSRLEQVQARMLELNTRLAQGTAIPETETASVAPVIDPMSEAAIAAALAESGSEAFVAGPEATDVTVEEPGASTSAVDPLAGEDPVAPLDENAAGEEAVSRADDQPSTAAKIAPQDSSRTGILAALVIALLGIAYFIWRRRQDRSGLASPDDAALNEKSAHFDEVFDDLHRRQRHMPMPAASARSEIVSSIEATSAMPVVSEPDTPHRKTTPTVQPSDDMVDEFLELEVPGLAAENTNLDFDDLDLSDFDEDWLDQPVDPVDDAGRRAAVCIQMGDLSGARELLEQGLERLPDSVALKIQLLDVVAQLDDEASFNVLLGELEAGKLSPEQSEALQSIKEFAAQRGGERRPNWHAGT